MKKVEDQGFFRLQTGHTHSMTLVCGSTGSGKSILVNSIAWQLKHFKNFKVIYLTEKSSSCMENCFCAMERENSTQNQILENDWMLKDTVIKKEDIEIYHPFTFNFDEKKVPECIKLFTFPLKEIQDISYSALIGREIDSPTITLCQEVKKELTDKDDIFSFLFKAFEKSSMSSDGEQTKFSNSKMLENMGIPVDSYGSKRDIEQLKNSMSKLTENYFLQDMDCPINLDDKKMIEILNNDKTTFFTMWKINDDKLKYFIIIELLLKLEKLIPEHSKKPLLIVCEEIKILLPKITELKYEKVLINLLRKLLAGIRTAGRGTSVIATTQSYYETNSDFRDGCDDVILMKLGAEDQKSLARDYPISSDNLNVLNSLKRGELFLFNDLRDKNELATKYKVFHVPFCYREEGLPPFWTHWKHKYPELMVDYRPVIKDIKKKQEQAFKQQLERQEAFLKNYYDRKQKKEEKETVKEEKKIKSTEEVKIQPVRVKRQRKEVPEFMNSIEEKDNISLERLKTIHENNIDESKLDESKESNAYETASLTPEASWESRTFIIDGYTSKELEKMAVKYAIKVKDFNFIKKFSTREFVEQNYPEVLSEIE